MPQRLLMRNAMMKILANGAPRSRVRLSVLPLVSTVLSVALVGCNGLSAPPAAQSGQQTYFAPFISGGSATSQLTADSISDEQKTYSQTNTSFTGNQQGTQVLFSGTFNVLPRGLLDLSMTYACAGGFSVCGALPVRSPAAGGYAIELPNQTGAFLQIAGQPVTPLAATGSCPSLNSAETFQFIMLSAPSGATDTAFGSVNISTQGATVNFADIQQFTFPQGGGAPGTPKAPFATTATGACGFGAYGYTISSPATTVVTNPGGQETQSPYAVLGIGPTGLLIESALTANGLPASNLLGGGTGAVGVPQPSSALGANPVSGQGQAPQYLGFIAGAGELVSLGFATQPSSCTSVAPSTATLIYGGDFQNGDPTTSPDGYSQCNFALDLGQESSTSHGLYPSATVWTGSGFHGAHSTSSAPAVAVVGQLQGKFVILVITQTAAYYFTQTN